MVKYNDFKLTKLFNLGSGISTNGQGLLQNNTVIIADANGGIEDIYCSSGSTVPNTGSWISPTGADVTNDTIDPFEVKLGGIENPASLVIHQRNGHLVTRSFQGVYTCKIKDDMQELNYLQVGIYPTGFNSKKFFKLKYNM